MKNSYFFLIGLGFVVALSSQANAAETPPPAPTSCSYAREYITALEYLRANKEFSIPEKDARNVAQKVSKGCTGAAKRFIKVTSLLIKSGVSGDNSLQTGIKFAEKTDIEAETFSAVFLKSFLEEYLDLDIAVSLNMAHALSTEFKGDTKTAQKDFEKLVEFCISGKGLDLPRPQCGSFASRIAQYGETYPSGVATLFIKTLHFLNEDGDGPELTRGQALPLAEQIVANGKETSENFVQAFKYGVSKKGLEMDVNGALKFAQQIALQSPAQNLQANSKPGATP